jgi:hypothetical protein
MLLSAMTWQEVDQLDRSTVVVVPFGAMEQHGPHLPRKRMHSSGKSWPGAWMRSVKADFSSCQSNGSAFPPIT